MMAANATIGVARAAYFPALTLAGQGGFQSTAFSNWLQAPSSFWAVGPNALLSVFDGGLRRAQVAEARAAFEVTAANYRGTVVNAFQEVEDGLAKLNHYHDAAAEEGAAVDAAQRTLNLSMALYQQGAVDYLTVVASQTTLLQTQLEALNLRTLQLRASVDLIRALGGGWTDSVNLSPDRKATAEVPREGYRLACAAGVRDARPCGASKSRIGPDGTIPVGLMPRWLW